MMEIACADCCLHKMPSSYCMTLPPECKTATRALPMTKAVLAKMLAIHKRANWLPSMAAAPAAA